MNTAEIDDGPHADSASALRGVLAKFQALQAAIPAGASIDPASAWMGERPGDDMITDNPYVHVMIEKLGSYIREFVGHGVHEHYDVATENIHTVARYLQLVAPLLNAGLQAAPHMHNETSPHLSEVFAAHPDVDMLREVEARSTSDTWHSVRYPTRSFASTQGGVASMTQSTAEDVMHLADRGMRDGFINNVSRAYGPHTDVRMRYDLAPGRVELCAKDNPLGRLETTAAYMDLTWAFIRAVEDVSERGSSAVEQMHENYDELFGRDPNPTEMSALFERTHRNSMMIAKDGPSAFLEDANGFSTSVGHQMGHLIKFVKDAGYPVDQASVNVIYSSLLSANVGPNATLAEYYATGVGTPADYHHRRTEAMKAAGMSDERIVRTLSQERTAAFGNYLTSHAA
jgi:hypothetical protein